ncbi:GntR family transcriptional regulator [Pseudoclavibacter sp. RFBJ3]|nr:GntR family transcriptional regulator [Pseudoclavibacter sp. RFBJ5]PPF91634.1 GntR family transcriptional regulator [Pseudoclavibacter sp. RFBJ3]PPF97518.1 GntR family transcriptional regulator [Pseudoclavibacter sp. RFBH5]PPG22413.1 GntR family transcriptional regulator [Pseudoclavibacter sp. RFBI4]
MTGVAETLDPSPSGKTQLAYEFIEQRISDGTFAPGHRLVLGAIAGKIGVSTLPVREALRMLEAEGAVTYERYVGAHVTGLEPERYWQALESLAILDGYATASAARHLTEDMLSEARSANAEMGRMLVDPDDPTGLHSRFHHLLFRRSPNTYLVDLVERTWRHLDRLRSSAPESDIRITPATIAEHDHLLSLLEIGAPSSVIEQAVRDHHRATSRAHTSEVPETA